MKNFFRILFPLFILFLVYQYRENIGLGIVPFANKVFIKLGVVNAPCEKPIVYNLGTFNEKFNIPQSDFLNALNEAEMIWEKPFGKELFTYDKDSTKINTLKVNLVYDYRQQLTSKLADLGVEVKQSRIAYNEIEKKITSLKNNLSVIKSDYEMHVNTFNTEQAAYEEKVKYWNNQGGAPKKEYDELQIERMEFNEKISQLKSEQKEMNKMIEEINSLVVEINRLAKTLNLSVEKYNDVGASRGESFEEGVYQQDGLDTWIDIYEFSNREQLIRVLAHEFGHALGLEHVDDKEAIMYEINQGDALALTEADLVALKIKCQVN